MSDLIVLQALMEKRRFKVLESQVPKSLGDNPTAMAMMGWYREYFKAFPGHDRVDPEVLDWLVDERIPDPENRALMKAMTQQLRKPVDEEALRGVVRVLYDMDYAGQVAGLVMRWQQGGADGDFDLLSDLDALTRRVKQAKSVAGGTGIDISMPSIDDILAEVADDRGIKFRRWVPLFHGVAAMQGGASVAIAGRPDKGKCLALGTLVRMYPSGVKKVEDVRVGDTLMGPDSTPRNVLGTTTGQDFMYRVRYPWGEGYTVNSEHVLSLKRSKVEGAHQYGDILNVPVREYIQWPEGRKARYKGWKAGVEYPRQTQVMPAYLLGLWLGDGTTTKPQITTTDPEVLAAFHAEYGPHSKCRNGITYDFYRTRMLADLRFYGLIGSKHIPDQYMRGSRAQRLELLAGLIDSDGYAGDIYEIVTKLPALAEQYVELARSLGFHATANPAWKKATNTDDAGAVYWRVRIGAEAFGEVPVRLERKRGNAKARKRRGLQFGIEVEPLGWGDYAGFSLDGDHLFLLEDFTVTHNTSALADILTDFAPQCAEFFGKGRPILWFNNEGSRKRIIPRLYNAALGLTLEEIAALSRAGTLEAEYTKALGGTKIIVLDVHGLGFAQLEQIIEEVKPCVVVWDMLANVHGGGTAGGNKADEVEAKWQIVREYAVMYDFISIATVQISAEGGNQLFPPYSAMKDSKTGIQGATDLIIMLGALDSPDVALLRGVSTPKNKYAVTGQPSYLTAECTFDPPRSRWLFGSAATVPYVPPQKGASNGAVDEGKRVAQAQPQNEVPGSSGAEGGRNPLSGPTGPSQGRRPVASPVPQLRRETAEQPDAVGGRVP